MKTFLAVLLFSFIFISNAKAGIRDVDGNLVPGVYRIEIGSRYSPYVEIEILKDANFRMRLRGFEPLVSDKINHFLEGRIETVRQPD